MASYRDYLESGEVVVQLGTSNQPGRELDSAESTGPLQARILWPALGFPATIAPRSQASGSPFKSSDATRCVTLLVLTNREVLSPAEVAGALRYVPWSGRGRRNLPAGAGASFTVDEIEIWPAVVLPDSRDRFGEIILFGGGPETERIIMVNLANRVREFYRGVGLPNLKEIRISEQASARLADGLYHLFWNNTAPGEQAPSDEMALLVEKFARPRRSKLGDLWQREGRYLLEEYQYEYRPMHPSSGDPVKGKRTEILHPLFVDRARTERLRIGHLTDTHISVREDVYEQNLLRRGRTVAFNNWNTSFVKGYDGVKRDSDIILLTGDIIDYGRGHWGREQFERLADDGLYHEDRNWFLFHDLLASGEAYRVPVYTSLGNHDWRINPYPPFAVAGAPGPRLFLHDHARYSTEEQKHILELAHGEGYKRKFSYQTRAESKAQLILEEPGSALKAFGKLVSQTRTLDEPGSPTETTVESVAWYLMAINPFFDYAFVLPSGHQVLMLDWAEDEDVLFPIVFQGREWPYMLWQLETASNPGPKAKRCITPLQKRLVTHLLETPGRAKLIGMHSPPIGPYPDWLDLDMLAGRKTYTDKSKARGRLDYGTKRPDGTTEPWNGHPIFAIRPRSGDAGMDTDYNSFVEWRDEFIKQVADPAKGVRAVFSGHIHRNGLYAAYRAPAARGPLLAGEMLVRGVVEPAVRGARPPAIVRTPDAFTGPLYVNTTSGGPRGNNMSRPPTEAERKTGGLSQDPGYARLDLSLDGTIQMVEFRSSLAPAAQKPAGRELAIEIILEELGLGSGSASPEVPGWIGAPATAGAPAAVMEANPMVEQLTGTTLGGYGPMGLANAEQAEQPDSAVAGDEVSTGWGDTWQAIHDEGGPAVGEEVELEDELDEDDPSAAERDEVDTASNEYEPIDPAANEYPSSVEFAGTEADGSVASAAGEIDTDLFQRLMPSGAEVERTLLAAKIASGTRDQSALTDFVFFFRHPELKGTRLGKGQEALMAEWLQIRDELVRPALTSVATSSGGATATPVGAPSVPLGTLMCNVPGRQPFSYAFTPDDLVWTARFLTGEAGGRDDPQNRSIIWAMFNRYAFFRNGVPSWGTFGDFIRQYSTTLQPYLKTYGQVKEWADRCNATFDNEGCNYQPTSTEVYPGTSLRKGQLKTFLKLQQTPWSALKESARRLATQALSGQIENPVGNASEFADTAVYYERKHKEKPTREQWESYTRDYAAANNRLWRPGLTPYDEFHNNVMFINGAAATFPPNATRVVRAGASAPSPTAPAPAPAPSRPSVLSGPGGGPSLESLYDGTTPAPGTVEKRRSYLNNPPVKGDPSNRNRMLYDNVINQFAVEVNPRYRQGITDGKVTSTYCNIFSWDVTRAMGAEIPHWVSPSGERMAPNDGSEINANATFDWLNEHGSRFGWRKVADAGEAQALANEGHPVVASWKNPKLCPRPNAPRRHCPGHIAVVRPGELTDKGPAIAQAGATNSNDYRWKSIVKPGTAIELWAAT